jgi:Asp-tRNA(Asn)/Glu-tRNA(Gln) amidotransferase A subunit family amidase
MRFEEYRKHDAVSLAGLVAQREVSAQEVLETAIERAETVNPVINAIVHKQYEQALKAVAAGPPEGPLKGVPFLVKDLGFFETGEPATFGSSLFKDFVADHETAYVTRCKKAGLVFMGRSSSPEFGLNPNTEPRLHGSCHNPWNLDYSAGGSSGGAAAAVSAGILPVAHATDGGGSIRIPAAQCGLKACFRSGSYSPAHPAACRASMMSGLKGKPPRVARSALSTPWRERTRVSASSLQRRHAVEPGLRRL